MPFRFAPVALDVKFSLWVYRLRFLTFGLFLWRGFFGAEKFSEKQAFLCRSCSSLKPVFFANLKTVKRAVKNVFLLANLRLEVSFQFGSFPFSFMVLSQQLRAIFQCIGMYQRLCGQRTNKQFKRDS